MSAHDGELGMAGVGVATGDGSTVARPGPGREEEALPGAGGDALVRALNFTVALVGLVLCLPLMLAIALAIKLDSPGPVLYRQLRIGLDQRQGDGRIQDDGRRTFDMGGRPFVMYKFRTMQVRVEQQTGPVWAARTDDRTTRVGRFLRHYRLDELPQLWNVLRGDMAVVGPRPERPNFVNYLRDEISEYPRRQRVPPGITGWAQIHRETDQTLEDVREKLRYDLDYVERRSVWLDVKIMLQTPMVMVDRDRVRTRHDRESRVRS